MEEKNSLTDQEPDGGVPAETVDIDNDDVEEEEDFAQLYEDSIKDLKEREVVTGSVIGISEDGVLVDVGYKSEGIIPSSQFEDENGEITVAVGDQVEVFLEKKEDSEGLIYLSKEKADKMKVWNDIGKAYDENEPILGRIISRIKGGLTVDIGVKAFLPGSQVDIRPIRNLDRLVNEEFYFKIIKFNPRRGNVVLSRRVLLEQERESKKEETLKILKEDSVMEGVVKNITDYGAFIDLGGIDGLLHITDLSWGRLQHPSEILTVGEKINVKVLKFDRDKERVSLGMKQLTEDPWEAVPGRYPVGSQVQGKVVSITDYGAFVKLEDGVEGLVHISEMTWNRKIKHPSKLVEIGDLVDAEVLSIDPENRRISLGMKQVEPNPWEVVAEKYPTGSIIEGKVRTLTDFGAFVGLEEGIDGLIHVSDMSWIQKVNHPTELLKKGDSVKAVVLSVDKARERLSLGLKQLTPNPWEEIEAKFPVGSTVVGKVVSHADFGTFVQVMDGIEGLIHVSEMGLDEGQNSEDVYPPDSEVKVKVLSVDPEERKVSLSISAIKAGSDSSPYTSYLNSSDGGGTLGDILGESLAAQRPDGDQPEEDAVLQDSADAGETPSAETVEDTEVEVEETPEEELAAQVASEEDTVTKEQTETVEEPDEEEPATEPATEEEPAEEVEVEEEEEEEEKTS